MKKSYVTTKQGDSGNTRLLDGQWVPKNAEIIECLGALDNLRAHLAFLKFQISQTDNPHKEFLIETLVWLIHCCFITGTQIVDPKGSIVSSTHPRLSLQHLERLEQCQERLEEHLQLPRKFIAYGSNPVSAYADIVTTVAREFERRLVSFINSKSEKINEVFIPFYNRLSDFLFITARILDDNEFHTVDYTLVQ